MQLCNILLEIESMDNIFSTFHSHDLVTIEDVEIFQHFAYNKYLQKQFLLRHLLQIKLPVWLAVCDVLLKVKAMEQTGNKLLNGKFTIYLVICICNTLC